MTSRGLPVTRTRLNTMRLMTQMASRLWSARRAMYRCIDPSRQTRDRLRQVGGPYLTSLVVASRAASGHDGPEASGAHGPEEGGWGGRTPARRGPPGDPGGRVSGRTAGPPLAG